MALWVPSCMPAPWKTLSTRPRPGDVHLVVGAVHVGVHRGPAPLVLGLGLAPVRRLAPSLAMATAWAPRTDAGTAAAAWRPRATRMEAMEIPREVCRRPAAPLPL